MAEDKELQELLHPAPFKHTAPDVYEACSISKDRAKGLTCHLQMYEKKNIKKRSEVIEFIESSLDLTKREQIVLAFKLGQNFGR